MIFLNENGTAVDKVINPLPTMQDLIKRDREVIHLYDPSRSNQNGTPATIEQVSERIKNLANIPEVDIRLDSGKRFKNVPLTQIQLFPNKKQKHCSVNLKNFNFIEDYNTYINNTEVDTVFVYPDENFFTYIEIEDIVYMLDITIGFKDSFTKKDTVYSESGAPLEDEDLLLAEYYMYYDRFCEDNAITPNKDVYRDLIRDKKPNVNSLWNVFCQSLVQYNVPPVTKHDIVEYMDY